MAEMIAIVIRGGVMQAVLSGTKPIEYVLVDFDQDRDHPGLVDFGDLSPNSDSRPDKAMVAGGTSEVDWLFVERAYDAVAAQEGDDSADPSAEADPPSAETPPA